MLAPPKRDVPAPLVLTVDLCCSGDTSGAVGMPRAEPLAVKNIDLSAEPEKI